MVLKVVCEDCKPNCNTTIMLPIKFNTDRIVGVSAMIISLSTLIVFIYQTNLMREHQYQSVFPYLSMNNERTGFPDFAIVLTNDGIGPAFIESSVFTYKGQKHELDLIDFLYKFYPEIDSIPSLVHSNLRKGLVIPAGRRIELLRINEKENMDPFFQLVKILEELEQEDIEWDLIYRDIYGNKWLLAGDDGNPEKIN
ncbi:MAG: hypothetical protein AAFO07_22340 [Bacteroidota bacterium]